MFAKIIISACIVAVARAGLLAQPAIAASYAAPAYASYAAPAIASYAAPAYASYAAPAYAAQSYGAYGYGGNYGYGSHYAEPALAHTSENTYRSAGNLHTVSTQSRTIATPYSTSNKHFTKVTNPGIYAHAAPVAVAAYAAPIAHHAAYAAPIAHHATYAAPIAHHAAYAAPIAHHTAIAAPIAHHAAYAAPIAHAGLATTYSSGHGHAALGYAAGHSYGHSTQSASLLGVAYSPAVGVSHVSYSSPIGINYGW